MKRILIIFCIGIVSFISGCGPGHHLAFKQFRANYTGPILSVQGYVIDGDNEKEELQKRWAILAEAMRQKAGFVSGRLSAGIGESTLWLAHSEWENLDDLRKAFSDPEVLRLESLMPKHQFAHLFALGKKGRFQKNKP